MAIRRFSKALQGLVENAANEGDARPLITDSR
ncbi:hypothetical protein SAMN05192558_102528 [Actinokineospora alba]|uniref:Uncharacterized protein n=1 Tax=Actinokineospora alba TaxID=504798 RepID=A0A1H0IF43_9PSEU|nr:hypothetical protein SAMN05421871_108227 [Actinokineospora alba]SDO29956.1 hypothetical protein SAMN05192558_102528 [Actinokineospora alba]